LDIKYIFVMVVHTNKEYFLIKSTDFLVITERKVQANNLLIAIFWKLKEGKKS